MNVGRRHRLEIVTEILRNAKGGIQKTQLVYLTNINFTLLKKYQNLLVEKGLIESTNGQIRTTEAGIEFISKYDKLMSIWVRLENRKPTNETHRKVVLTKARQEK